MRTCRLWPLRIVLLAALVSFAFQPLLEARRLPIKTYTTANGLARDHILCIVQDSHGFLWFCTAEGLSRFDGYEFTNYHVEQGLPANAVTDFLETRKGDYFVATTGGLCRFEPASAPARFRCFPKIGGIGVLYEDRQGAVWAGSDETLIRLDSSDASGTFQPSPLTIPKRTSVTSILQDHSGLFWVGTSNGLYRYDPVKGSAVLYTKGTGLPNEFVMATIEDHEGRLWVGTRVGLARLDPGSAEFQIFTMKDGLPANRIESLLESSDHTVWIGTTHGLAEWSPAEPSSSGGRHHPLFQSFSLEQGLTAHAVGALAEDRDGNLWIGTFGSGLMRIAQSGFNSYNGSDGIPFADAFAKGSDGSLYVVSRGDGVLKVNRFDGRTFKSVRPAWPSDIDYFGWGRSQIAFQSARDHDWWIATGRGLCRFPRDLRDTTRPTRIYTARDGLPGSDIFRTFEDSQGDVWIGTIGPPDEDGLALWSRRTGAIRVFHESDGLPHAPVPTAFAEDRNGTVWISLFHGGLASYRRDSGNFAYFDRATLPGFLNTLYPDAAGRLWIGTSRGLIRIDDPLQNPPRFTVYKTAQGLSSNSIEAITEDSWGRIYLATGRGVDRFEPLEGGGLGHMKHYTTADGITPGELNLAIRDNSGGIWLGSALGVSRLTPAQDPPRPPPPVLLTGLTIGGAPQPVSDLGQPTITGLRLPQTPLRIDFVGLDYSPGEALQYQYMLEGADHDWGSLSDQRSVIYGSLSPGSYRFLVRAVTSEGSTSAKPAELAFTILPPLWRTWWFLTLGGLSLAAIAWGLHRYRLGQLLAVANVRTHIATDLHDDIGASLSQIAVLSEVALRTGNEADPSGATPLHEIASISRELIDGLSDIVWAINPEHDRLDNLFYRMRRVAGDLLSGHNIELQFHAGISDPDVKIPADIRRHIYLIFKEGIHNIARHSGATQASVEVEFDGDHFELRLSDNGKGFDPDAEYDGRGLLNMRKRAAAIGGTVQWRSPAGGGSEFTCRAPAGMRRPLAALRGK